MFAPPERVKIGRNVNNGARGELFVCAQEVKGFFCLALCWNWKIFFTSNDPRKVENPPLPSFRKMEKQIKKELQSPKKSLFKKKKKFFIQMKKYIYRKSNFGVTFVSPRRLENNIIYCEDNNAAFRRGRYVNVGLLLLNLHRFIVSSIRETIIILPQGLNIKSLCIICSCYYIPHILPTCFLFSYKKLCKKKKNCFKLVIPRPRESP